MLKTNPQRQTKRGIAYHSTSISSRDMVKKLNFFLSKIHDFVKSFLLNTKTNILQYSAIKSIKMRYYTSFNVNYFQRYGQKCCWLFVRKSAIVIMFINLLIKMFEFWIKSFASQIILESPKYAIFTT